MFGINKKSQTPGEPNVLIVQPFIPHYRSDFFLELKKKISFDLVTVFSPERNEGFKITKKIKYKNLKSYNFGSFIYFNTFIINFFKYEIIVIPWAPKWISIYFLLLLKRLFNLKIVIWTHGDSIKNGFNPQKIRDKIKIFIFNKSDGICFYTQSGLRKLKPYIRKPKLFFINNTLNVEKIQSIKNNLDSPPKILKKKYGINASRVIIYCARFIEYRRIDKLVEFINIMTNEDVHFIIIGSGKFKPNFTQYSNVHDLGQIYDDYIKSELFSIADFSFQPAWSGLSVVESIANGVPYTTLKKSKNIFQCVEYSYIKNGINGFIVEDLLELKDTVLKIKDEELNLIKNNCINYSIRELSLIGMVNKFRKGIINI